MRRNSNKLDRYRPNKLSELYLIADIIFDIFVLLVLSAIFGPIIEKIAVTMVGEIVGLISGIWVISIIALVVLSILASFINETIYNYSMGKLAEAKVEIEKQIEENEKRIQKLTEEMCKLEVENEIK